MQPSILKTLARLSFLLEISTGGKLETDWCVLVITCPEVSKDQHVVSNQALDRGSHVSSLWFSLVLYLCRICHKGVCKNFINIWAQPLKAEREKERRIKCSSPGEFVVWSYL